MNEPKETQENKLQQDAELSSQGDKATSQDIPETLTRTEAQRLIHNAETAVGSKMGRELKAAKAEADRVKAELESIKPQLDELRRKQDEQDEEEAKGSPESLRIYQKQKQLRDQEAQLRQRQVELEKKALEQEEKLRYADEAKTEMAIISIALESHLDIGELKEAARELNLTTEEQVSKLAERLSSKKLPPRGDSGKTVGGTPDFDKMSPTELIKYGLSQKK